MKSDAHYPDRQDDEIEVDADTPRSKEVSGAAAAEREKILHLQGEQRYKDELLAALEEVVENGHFHLTETPNIYSDKKELERACGMKLDKEMLYLGAPFVAHWEGGYHSDTSRMQLTVQLFREERRKKPDLVRSGRSDSVHWYFEGCAVDQSDLWIPADQDPADVLRVLENDCAYVNDLPLTDTEKQEVIRRVQTAFLQGEYPIVLHRDDSASRDAMRRKIMQIAQTPVLGSNRMLRPGTVASAMQRYRVHVAQGLDHETEEIKRRHEERPIAAMQKKQYEAIQQVFQEELHFLQGLDISEQQRRYLRGALENSAHLAFLRDQPEYRDTVYADVRTLLSLKPKEEYLSLVALVLTNFWQGRYVPDQLRPMVLRNELQYVEEEGNTNEAEQRRSWLWHMYVDGGSAKHTHTLAAQDPINIGRAYQRDIQLIRSCGLDAVQERDAIWEYNSYVLQGKLPLAADRETDEERQTLAEALRAYVQEGIHKGYVSSMGILQKFCDHWYPIAAKSVQK